MYQNRLLPPMPAFRFSDLRSFTLGLMIVLSMISPQDAQSQSCQDASVELSAVVQADPPRITLHWRENTTATQHTVYRKLKSGSSWGAIIGSLSGIETQFIDSTVSVGVSYEYRVVRQASNYSGYGYINAGIEVPVVHSRGILILIVDETFVDSLASEIARLRHDLEGDGWKVVQHTVARDAAVPYVKSLIVQTYDLDRNNTKAVFLLGRIPVPYSGDIYPDGHDDHEGAWPADVYYADMNGVWTDQVVNVTVASAERHRNIPKDGKFDQSLIPTDVELQIGRVDFANMPAFAASEQQLLKNYLDKDHAYRHKKFTAAYRGVIDDNFGFFGTEAFAASGWKNIAPLVGSENVIGDDYLTVLRDSSYLWSYGCGGGSYTSAGGIGSTNDFAASDLKSVFTMLFGSYFGDWDATNNFLRAPLAQGTTLTNAWSGRPHWVLHHMGLGENIGYGTRITQNNSNLYFSSYGARFVHIALMGDPTLRNDVVAPAADLGISPEGLYHQLLWTPSPDPVVGYNIYMRNESSPDFVLLNSQPLPDIAYANLCVADTGLLTYMVRAVSLQQSSSGTYYNMSQGVTDTITWHGIPTVQAYAEYVIDESVVTFTNQSLNASEYHWDFGDGNTSAEANPEHIYLDGSFGVTLIASNGCTSDTFHFDVDIFTGLNDLADDPSIVVAPNPSDGLVKVRWENDVVANVNIQVYAAQGGIVFERTGLVNGGSLDLTGLTSGMYIMHIVKNGEKSMKRLVIQR